MIQLLDHLRIGLHFVYQNINLLHPLGQLHHIQIVLILILINLLIHLINFLIYLVHNQLGLLHHIWTRVLHHAVPESLLELLPRKIPSLKVSLVGRLQGLPNLISQLNLLINNYQHNAFLNGTAENTPGLLLNENTLLEPELSLEVLAFPQLLCLHYDFIRQLV